MIRRAAFSVALTALAVTGLARADIVHNDDVIVNGSLCVGFDCVNGENFGFDTLRLKENNLRIHFDDTSNSASFPRNDWRIIANDSTNGGDSYLAIEDSTAGRIPFRVEAGAPNHSLFVENTGQVGFGTNNPVVELHSADGDTPTLRLEQNGTSGWTPQTWDLAGNETNFFVRDVSNGSKLPFRIQPNAPTNSIYVENTGDVGFGTQSPSDDLHVLRTVSEDMYLYLENTVASGQMDVGLKVRNTAVDDGNNDDFWFSGLDAAGRYVISRTNSGGAEFQINEDVGSGNTAQAVFRNGGNIVFEIQGDGDINSISGNFGTISDRNAKTDINLVDAREVLAKVSEIPISTWRYTANSDELHMGPMGQDFYAAFGLHEGPTSISLSDLSGVALAAVKGLNEAIEEKDVQIQDLLYRVSLLETQLAKQ